MLQFNILLSVAATLVMFIAPVRLVADESQRLHNFLEKAFGDEVSRKPAMQARLGIKTNYGEWGDFSDGGARREFLITSDLLSTLRSKFDISRLSERDQLSFSLFEYRCEQALADYPWRFHTYPVNQMSGLQSQVPAFLINIHRVTNVSDAEAYVSRLKGVRSLMSQLIANIDRRREMGIIVPAFAIPYVLQDCENLLQGKPFTESEEDCTLLADFRMKIDALDIDRAVEQRLVEEATRALQDDVQPAYKQLIECVQSLAEVATTDDGAWKLPNGSAFYRHALRKMTTTDLLPDAIHELGLSEVARIHGEMRAITRKVEFEGSLQDFFEFTRDDPQFYYSNDDLGREQYLAKATELVDAMRDRLDELFLRKPRAPMIVKRVEAFREKSAAKAFYMPPAPNGSRPGVYYANLFDMNEMPKYQMEALAYHEGIPGHHMQASLAQELEGVPRFRKFGLGLPAYSEGWGLYTELIPKEIGCYADPYSDFGRLSMELWRAARLVVDTGIHTKRWTRQQAIDYLMENTPNPQGDCRKAIERYIVMPGQAAAYKIGMIKILELRESARQRLGERFDLREFHDVILRDGPMPLTLLEERVVSWEAERADQ